jgi:hypothetical protein
MSYDITRSVLKKAVKYSMTPDDAAELVNYIFSHLEWDNDCPCDNETMISCATSLINDNASDKQAIIDWVNKYKQV